MVKGLSFWFAGKGPVFDSHSRRYHFKNCLSPASKSYISNIAEISLFKAT